MKLFKKKKKHINVDEILKPKHIGIIMDGNGRWAKKRGLPRTFGHTTGAKRCKEIAKYCNRIGIEHLTVYAFSTENWKRSEEEIDGLMKLFKDYLKETLRDVDTDTLRINFIGDLRPFDDEIKELVKKSRELSKTKTGTLFNIAINYGGRAEVVTALKKIAHEIENKKLSSEDITEQLISDNIYTAGQPDPDLIIRTGGEHRVSNFMLWQSAYAEYYITDLMWPDFTTDSLDLAIKEYSMRNRRHGGA